ncbi:TonB-dependent receptor family protein [Flavihumibacter solisilvae]|uniref:TonB-dependent receptor n=1 Tax=Flavihumibacter solisilvae TaxID=1349421 RepID=A0A0C1L3V6_9BACT|nr:TonB-dependent receptor [Flavihumibacter solisilvae]KIC94712.1 hypothetical protein OI18_09495 [Flavihumibacter solisilvae]
MAQIKFSGLRVFSGGSGLPGLLIIVSALGLSKFCFAQDSGRRHADSLPYRSLDSVLVTADQRSSRLLPMPAVKGTYIYAGRKTETVRLDYLDANRVDNNPRQLFAKVPGIFVYENDGTGNQVNISARALTAHRSWEMNVRHNDVMTNSDLYGYPASHFNAPTESIERIELVRGSGSLQYGAQFGGMVNYVTKDADTTKRISFESSNSVGSYGLFSTYNAVGGKVNRLKYYSYVNYRKSDGYRDNSEYKYFAAHAHLEYQFSRDLSMRLEYNHMDYVNHINGGLNDVQFRQNPRQSTRNRNYYSPTIHLPSIRLDYSLGRNTQLNVIGSAVLGSRNSVQFIALSTVADTINAATGEYNPRQVDIDNYHSYSAEARVRHYYQWFGKTHAVVGGVRYINNNLGRHQLGKGTTGSDYDLSLTDPKWGRDMSFRTKNVSVFSENMLQLHRKLSFTAGFRFENGSTRMGGYIYNIDPVNIPVEIDHSFFLLGASMQYEAGKHIQVFANWSQAYRPVIFADIIPATTLNKIDPGIKDAYGNNAELGLRGTVGKRFRFDANIFLVDYKNRTGNVAVTDGSGATYLYKTNTGRSLAEGLEVYAELDLVGRKAGSRGSFGLSVFTSSSVMYARYRKGTVVVSGNNTDIKGNKVEAAPPFISRNGLQFKLKRLSSTLQYSYTAATYADPLNTETPNASGTVGRIPGYQLVDWNFTYRFEKFVTLRLLMNNIFNRQYFTQRPAFFPGPGGLYPSDGRSIIISAGINL